MCLACRTHRQRTQGYIRELEKEVLRLRDNESVLKAGNSSLKDALVRGGLPLPNHGDSPDLSAGVSIASDLDLRYTATSLELGNSVTVDLTELNAIEAEEWCSVTAAMEDRIPFEAPTALPSLALICGDVNPPRTLREGSVGNYGSAPALSPQAAIDFVLEYGHRLSFDDSH